VDFLGFFALYGLSILALLFAAIEFLEPPNLLPYIIAAAALPWLVLPIAWAWLLQYAKPMDGADIEPRPKPRLAATAGWTMAGLLVMSGVLCAGFLMHTSYRFGHMSAPSTTGATPIVERDTTALACQCTTTTGERITLGELSQEIVFLNVWATWCRPCVAEMPSIAALRNRMEPGSVRFLLVSNESLQKVRAFAEERDFDLPFASASSLPEALRTQAIPATFVLHRDRVIYQHVGGADWNDDSFFDWLRAIR